MSQPEPGTGGTTVVGHGGSDLDRGWGGAEREAQESLPCLEQLPLNHIARRNAQAAQERAQAAGEPATIKPKRVLSWFNRGWRLLMRLFWRLQDQLAFSLPVEPWPHLPELPVEGGFFGSG